MRVEAEEVYAQLKICGSSRLLRVDHGSRVGTIILEEKHGNLIKIMDQMKRRKLLTLHGKNSRRTGSE